MSTESYLLFSAAGYRFLLPVLSVREAYDPAASAEPLDKILTGSEGHVYWRGQLALRVDLTALLGGGKTGQHCLLACAQQHGPIILLAIDAVEGLRSLSEDCFVPMAVRNEGLARLSDTVARVSDGLAFLLSDLAQLHNFPGHVTSFETDY